MRLGGVLNVAGIIATIQFQHAFSRTEFNVSEQKARRFDRNLNTRSRTMFRDIILWLAGVPIIVIVLLHLTGLLHY